MTRSKLLRRAAACCLALSAWCAAACADDWPQWRGPRRDGISRETFARDKWAAERPLKVVWRAEVGKGHSAVSIAGGKAYTLGWDGSQDSVYCFHAATGAKVWSKSYPSKTIVQWPGPRATPTVDGDAVYTLEQWGRLVAWDAQTGDKRWETQLASTYNPDVDYGFAWSPLVQGNLLILSCGSRGLAIDKRTGKAVWGDDGKFGACSSPVPLTHAGKDAVAVVVTEENREAVRIVGVEPSTGKELFRSPPWGEKWGAACVDLLVDDGKIFITTAEQFRQAGRFTIAGDTLTEDWSTNRLAGYTGACVLIDKRIYTVDGRGILKCVSWETGEEQWSQRGFDERGTLSAVGDKLLIQTGASGELVLAQASPEKYVELRRMKVFEKAGETFTVPVYANGRIYCRSYAGEVVCLE